ncbi:kinetochore-associated protein 1 [Dermacentor andersoni]|uniref:kinetochore-associated protein 1 n=1 Tax=Dermacentor andersoni TaxID=34620 RepID=UPI003B3A93B3
MMWSNVCANFDGETTLFGQRNEEKAGSQLYEVRTQFTICADTPGVAVNPTVKGVVSQKHLAVAIDDVVKVFKHGSFLFSTRFNAAVDAVALCSDVLDGLLIVAERSANLHIFTVESAQSIVKVPVPSTENDDTAALFRSVDVKKNSDSYTVCVLTGHHVITATISNAVIAQLASADQPDLSPLQIRIVDVNQHASRNDFMLSLVSMASACVLDDDLLVTGGQGAVCCIPMDANSSAYGILNNIAGERVRKMVVVDSLCTLLTLTEGSRLVTICLKTFLIKDIWSEKTVTDFVFCEEAAAKTERGPEQECRIAVLTATSETSTRRLEIYRFPDFSMQYALEVNETCHMMAFCDSLENFWIVEGFSDNEEALTGLRVRTISEALPENHLMKLINKNKFSEAEEFAKLFNLSVEEVHWHHLLYILKSLSIRLTDASMDEEDELKLVHEVFNLVKVLPDVLQVARCCIETPFASPAVASKLFLFLQGHVSSAEDCDIEERDSVSAQIMLLLNRATTFRFLCDSDFKSDWFAFSQADLIQEICVLFRDDHMPAGFFIWERHQDEFLRGLSCDVVGHLLDAIPITVELSSLLQWLKGSFLPLIVDSLPESLEYICQWIVDRVLQMEFRNKSLWPSGALGLVKVVLDHFQLTSTIADCFPLKTWLIVYGVPKRIRDKTSALCKLYHLSLDLQNLEVLRSKYKCCLTLQELQNTDKQEVAFAILDEAITKQEVASLVQGFLIQFVETNGLDISNVLQSYVDKVLCYKGVSLMHDELLEDKMVALAALIDHPHCWLVAVKKILSHAHVPWSESIQGLADHGSSLRGSAAREIDYERDRMQAKMILLSYDVNLFRSMALSTTSTLVKCILLSEKQEALQDALTVAKNLGDMSELDVFLLYVQMAYVKADINRFAEVLQSVPQELFLKVAPRLSSFAELLLKRHNTYSEVKVADLMECWQYLLSVLQQTSSASAIGYDTLHRQVRQGMVLRRDFGITVSAAELCCESDKHEVLKQGFQKVLLSEPAQDQDACKIICRKALYLAGVLKLDLQSAIEVMLTLVLELKRDDMVDSLCTCLLELHYIRESVLVILPLIFCQCEDVLHIATNVHKIASRIGLASTVNNVKKCTNVALWADILMQASVLLGSVDHSSTVSACVCSTKEQNFLHSRHGYALDKKQMLMHLAALGKSVWNFLDKKHPGLLEEVKLHLQATCQYLSQRSQDELCLSVVATVFQMFLDIPQQHSVHKSLQEVTEHQISKNTISIMTRASARKHADMPFLKGLLCNLQPRKALAMLKKLLGQCNSNFRLLKTVATVGFELCSDSAQKAAFRAVVKGAYWCQKLGKADISFADAMTNQNPAILQSVLEQMEKSSLIDVDDLMSYCSSFNINIELSLSRRLEFLLCTQAEDPCIKRRSLPQILAEASRVLEKMPKVSVQKVLMKSLTKVNPYHYEVLRFGYDYIRAIEEGPDSSVQREIDILHFLESYERYSPPSEQEMDVWCEEYPVAEISSLMQSRLPFRHLLKPSLWQFITNELHPETADAWLNVADTLRLNKDDIRFIAVDNAIRMWSAQQHNGNILDAAFISSVKRLIVQMNKKEKAVACLMNLLDNLPKGPTATSVARECATLPDAFFASGEAKSKMSDAKMKFRRKYIKHRNEQLLKQHNFNSSSYLALCGKTEDLVAALLEDTRWHLVFSDTSELYSCISQIAATDGVVSVDFSGLLEKSIKRWLGFQASEYTGDESTLEPYLEASHVGSARRSAGFITIVHLMQHIPEQMKEVLSCIASVSDGFIGLRPRVLAMMCMLAGLGISNPTFLDLPPKSGVSSLEELRALAYKARLQQLGVPLPSLDLDADGASEIVNAVLHLHNHNAVALELVGNLCIEYHVQAAPTWEAFLSAATSAGATDVLCRVLPTLGGHPLLWSKPAFICAWQYVLQSAPASLFSASSGLLQLFLRCPSVQSLPPLLHEDDVYCDQEGIMFYFVYMLVRESGSVQYSARKLLKQFSSKLLKLIKACKDQVNILKLPNTNRVFQEML